jgi:hypothetical protein
MQSFEIAIMALNAYIHTLTRDVYYGSHEHK